MMNRKKVGGRPVILLGDDNPVVESAGVDMSMLNRSEENVDRNNIKPNLYVADPAEAGASDMPVGESNPAVDGPETRRRLQQSVAISIENQRKMKKFSQEYGSTQTWIINTALSYFFNARGIG